MKYIGKLALEVVVAILLVWIVWSPSRDHGVNHPETYGQAAFPEKAVDVRRPAPAGIVTDTLAYRQKMLQLLHDSAVIAWPYQRDYPAPGALLPFHRIVAYYGNFYTPKLGVLGSVPVDSMLARLAATAAMWRAADSSTPVLPAFHYIAVTAQRNPGKDGKYRLRMPEAAIEKVLELAAQAHALVFLDIQPGHSTLQEELPQLEKYLARPEVHLGIDPEYSMKGGQVPCSVIGTLDAEDINYAGSWLAGLVKRHGLPPKILVVHRFTQGMVTNYRDIRLRPEVQIVMDMDGFGGVAKKKDTYRSWIARQPVQFTGFKLFYQVDVATGGRLMGPDEVLALFPRPIYIQYQ
ncbi:hypothetical protein SAMN04488128_103367 [Chitinophaga eiseniae]|uniref:Lipoprotein n=1 Tax=Chitinophaga eiseniae TaxID=634771 RepID=A0A1T4SRW0_9BACT|nr:hypothetical protein [Chitinophaga eiseniae]SKA30886.1 hypothetical protein SAMN04488128_103367 [Chitinophaga eiseniae]